MIKRAARKILHKMNNQELLNKLSNEINVLHHEVTNARGELQASSEAHIAMLRQEAGQMKDLLDAVNKQSVGSYLDRIYTRDKSKKSIFILGTHDWGNIGDLAISYAETVFLEKNFPEYMVFNITRLTLASNWQRIVSTITKDDVIMVHGGGNVGDIWLREENLRRRIVKTFSENIIVSLPQSIKFFDADELQQSAAVYNSHKKLLFTVRDDNSYELAKTHFKKAQLLRTEDIVMSYEYPAADWGAWDRILFVMRDDKEKREGSGIEELYESLKNEFPCGVTDTVVPGLEFVSMEYGAKLTYRKIDDMHASRLVVTDRLHGAIFALIAGKPVIVFDNNYGKIKGALKSIKKHLGDRILFANKDGSNITVEKVRKLYKLDETDERPVAVLAPELDALAKQIRQFIR